MRAAWLMMMMGRQAPILCCANFSSPETGFARCTLWFKKFKSGNFVHHWLVHGKGTTEILYYEHSAVYVFLCLVELV